MQFLKKYIDRIDELQMGIQELENWLLDVADQGLAALHQRETDYFENIASRLLDLKLSSIARRIRNMEKRRSSEQWLNEWQQEIASLHLFSKHFRKIRDYPLMTQLDLLQQAGLNLKKKEILEGMEPVSDYWIVLGKSLGHDEKMNWRRVWLWGEQQQMVALILDFAWGNTPFEGTFEMGTAFEANLCYYPSSTPTRALLKDVHPKDRPFARLDGINSLQQFNLEYTKALAQNPGLIDYPALLSEVHVFRKDDQFFICDQERHYVSLGMSDDKAWQLLALSGGKPMLLFGTWNGFSFQVLSCLLNKRIVAL